MTYGCLYVADGLIVQDNIDSNHWQKLDLFTRGGEFGRMAGEPGTDELEVIIEGIYLICVQLSYISLNKTTYTFALFLNEDTSGFQADSEAAKNRLEFCGVIGVLFCRANDKISVRCKTTDDNQEIILKAGQLLAVAVKA